jgi:GT2 family glycosyltransferase
VQREQSPSVTAAPAVALVTHNSIEHLRRFLTRDLDVARELGSLPVIVDNASTDGTDEYLRDIQRGADDVVVAFNDRNRGYACAVNQAFELAGGRDLLLINPDIELTDAVIVRELVRVLRSDDDVGIVGPQLITAGGIVQESARRFPSILAMGGHASFLRFLPAARRASRRYLAIPPGRDPVDVDWTTGAAMLIRHSAYVAAGGFDERFFLYLEDCDFCLRCARAGWRTVYVPSVRLPHLHPRASHPDVGNVFTSAARRAHIASMARFFLKHPRLALG